MNKLRIYVGIFLILITVISFGIIAYSNYEDTKKMNKEKKEKELMERLEKERVFSRPPLPVCAKGEYHINCRPLAADETGTTVRGVRDEIQID